MSELIVKLPELDVPVVRYNHYLKNKLTSSQLNKLHKNEGNKYNSLISNSLLHFIIIYACVIIHIYFIHMIELLCESVLLSMWWKYYVRCTTFHLLPASSCSDFYIDSLTLAIVGGYTPGEFVYFTNQGFLVCFFKESYFLNIYKRNTGVSPPH